MDPVSIVQIIGTAVSLGDVVLKCISRLHSLKAKYHDAPLIISTITGQLHMVQAALDQLSIWNKPEYGRHPRYRQLALQIGNFLDCFSHLILTLEQRLDDFEPNGSSSITAKQKFVFLWGEKETFEYSSLLDRQVNALNLLLQAVQWAEYQLNGRALYYATALKRLIKSNYIPYAEDTLWSRTMTTGVHKTVFEGQPSTAGIEYWFYDVGGTPVERKKWIHAFELGISTVIFTVDTTAYPKLLWEDNTVNRMQGDLTLFSSLVSSPWLTRSNLIVLFTKLDLLEECLRREPAHQYFSDYIYEGSELGIVEHYMEYLKGRFLSLIESDEVLSRTRTIQVNLVDVESQDQRMEVIRILNELTAMYPEISGFYENDMDFWKALPFPNMY
ncbi:G-protein alpha subunit-domain-containing protein [Xylaria longipes]|nr:G-protein alpha subunit-domain-containing protein [Xylaria longipes]